MKNLFGNKQTGLCVLQAIIAAALFGLNSPFAKLLLGEIPPMFMAAFLYLGAALGMSVIWLAYGAKKQKETEAKLSKGDAPWVILMILLDIAAPFLLMSGLALTTAANASLLMNFEMVATTVIALLFFKEAVGKRLWISIGIITVASIVLSVDFSSLEALAFSPGSLLILFACICWGLENNCTRNLSAKNPVYIVIIKGFGSGAIALVLAFASERMVSAYPAGIAGALVLGFISYGLSIFFYIKAQRGLGAARTSMYYAAAPFIGVAVSFMVFGERPGVPFGVGAVLMIAGAVFAILERHSHRHMHINISHEHAHSHEDEHHKHRHATEPIMDTVHTHVHIHEQTEHEHDHKPDIHHRHTHG